MITTLKQCYIPDYPIEHRNYISHITNHVCSGNTSIGERENH